jgi:gamma-glutamyl phosphate reductase
MDREQFEKEADECGMMEYLDLHCDSVGIQMILDMVNDAVAAEREACAKLVRDDYSNKHAQLWLKRIDKAVKAERERIIAANAPELERANAHIKALEDELASLRARST